jgi:hypothetical protein
MSVYLYNLIFSLSGSNVNAGRFQAYPPSLPPNPTILNLSSAWFQYTGSGTPFSLGPYFQVVTQALTPSQWGNAQSDVNSLQLNPGDYLMMRVCSADSNVNNYQMRFTGVFGRGTSQFAAPGAGELQSPLVMNSAAAPNNTLPRTVIDVDGSSGSNWPGPITSDGSWVTWLGEVYSAPGGAANDYTMNVGASVYVNANVPSNGNLFTFGHDPKMHVSGSGKPSEVAA